MLWLCDVRLQALSQFYLLLLHPSKLQCVNRVNGQVRQEIPLALTRSLGPAGAPTPPSLASDDAEGTVYVLSGSPLALCQLLSAVLNMHCEQVPPSVTAQSLPGLVFMVSGPPV